MAGKTPKQLRKQIEEQAKEPTRPGHTRTAEGEEVPKPERGELFENLNRVTAAEGDSPMQQELLFIRKRLRELEAAPSTARDGEIAALRAEEERLSRVLKVRRLGRRTLR
jgi:hypothetical protein